MSSGASFIKGTSRPPIVIHMNNTKSLTVDAAGKVLFFVTTMTEISSGLVF